MAMSLCNQCNENNWKFKFAEGWVTATCEMCGFEVEFEAKKKESQSTGHWSEHRNINGYPEMRNDAHPEWRKSKLVEKYKDGKKIIFIKAYD